MNDTFRNILLWLDWEESFYVYLILCFIFGHIIVLCLLLTRIFFHSKYQDFLDWISTEWFYSFVKPVEKISSFFNQTYENELTSDDVEQLLLSMSNEDQTRTHGSVTSQEFEYKRLTWIYGWLFFSLLWYIISIFTAIRLLLDKVNINQWYILLTLILLLLGSYTVIYKVIVWISNRFQLIIK